MPEARGSSPCYYYRVSIAMGVIQDLQGDTRVMKMSHDFGLDNANTIYTNHICMDSLWMAMWHAPLHPKVCSLLLSWDLVVLWHCPRFVDRLNRLPLPLRVGTMNNLDWQWAKWTMSFLGASHIHMWLLSTSQAQTETVVKG